VPRSGWDGGSRAFGARTGGATIILGVILLLTGAQLALGSCDFSKHKGERFITLVTAAFCIWNVGLGFLAGMVGAYLNNRGWLRL